MSIFLYLGLIKTFIVTQACRQISCQGFIGENRGFENWSLSFSLSLFNSYLDFLRWDNDNNNIFMFFLSSELFTATRSSGAHRTEIQERIKETSGKYFTEKSVTAEVGEKWILQ